MVDRMKPTDPDTIDSADQAKLIALYTRLCPDDQVTPDDPRMPVIAAEVLDVGRAATLDEALEVIDYWRLPQDWAREFATSVRRSIKRMKLTVD